MTTTPAFFKRLTGLRFCRPANPLSVDGDELTGTILSEPFDRNKGLGAPAWFVWVLTDEGETRTLAVEGLVFSADACDVLVGADGDSDDGDDGGDGCGPAADLSGAAPGPERYGDMSKGAVAVSPAYLHGLELLAIWFAGDYLPTSADVVGALEGKCADSLPTTVRAFCLRYNLTTDTITPKDGYND